MADDNKPAIRVFQTEHDEFLFLGKEYPLDSDMGAVWGDFIGSGGYEINAQHGLYQYTCMILYHNNNPEGITYTPGTIVGDVDEIPEGFVVGRYPAREYLVVTTDWMEDAEEASGENGLWHTKAYQETAPMPEGYERFDGPGSQINVIEVENTNTENGSRWEWWVPIRKIEQT
ncbi:MAG: GyrI-like domain-containing protein [Thermomicrobiales bacterium]|nr:GyrI-like domain-containing protein [Thermomicrobiales bacterium]